MRGRSKPELIALLSRVLLLLIAVGGIAVAAGLSATCCSSIAVPRAFATLSIGLVLGVGVIALAISVNQTLVKWLAGESLLVGLVLTTAEVAITAMRPSTWTQNATARDIFEQQRAAAKSGVAFDTRSISAVVAELRNRGVDALPGISRTWPTTDAVAPHLASDFYPLSHAANSTIVECNEGGEYFVYETDEFGFNNPRGLVSSRLVDIAVVGESHGLGYCVSRGQSTVDLIREAYPRTANFSLAGSRSLSQLGSFREYVEPLQPRVVLWFVNAGFAQAGIEADNGTLVRYLDESFSQRLIDRQAEVDALVRRFAIPIQETIDRAVATEIERASAHRFDNVYTLPQVRQYLGPLMRWSVERAEPTDFESFAEVIRIAQRAVARWDGVLMIVVMPDYGHIVAGEAAETIRHSLVLQIADELGLRAIDGAALFRPAPDPAGLFALRRANHPNGTGHALLAQRIIDELRGMRDVGSH